MAEADAHRHPGDAAAPPPPRGGTPTVAALAARWHITDTKRPPRLAVRPAAPGLHLPCLIVSVLWAAMAAAVAAGALGPQTALLLAGGTLATVGLAHVQRMRNRHREPGFDWDGESGTLTVAPAGRRLYPDRGSPWKLTVVRLMPWDESSRRLQTVLYLLPPESARQSVVLLRSGLSDGWSADVLTIAQRLADRTGLVLHLPRRAGL